MKMLHQALPAGILVKIMGFRRIYRNFQPVSHILRVNSADKKGIVADYLGRHIFVYLVHQFPPVFHFRQVIVAGSHIGNGKTDFIGHISNAHQIIIFCFFQRLHI